MRQPPGQSLLQASWIRRHQYPNDYAVQVRNRGVTATATKDIAYMDHNFGHALHCPSLNCDIVIPILAVLDQNLLTRRLKKEPLIPTMIHPKRMTL